MHYITKGFFLEKNTEQFTSTNKLLFVASKIQNLFSKSFIFSKNFGSVSAWFFAVSAETPKLAEMPISAETEAETENSVVH